MRRYRKTFSCVRCEGLTLKTGEQMISHFRLIHGIKPETFCSEKRKAFYDTFKLGYNEYCKDTDEEIGETDSDGGDGRGSPSPADDSTHRRYNSLTPKCIPESVQLDRSRESVQNMTMPPVATQNDPITSQGDDPYFCPDCGKGVGYSIHSFRSHFRVSGGLCKTNNARKRFHRCLYCQTDFSKSSSLSAHNARFGGKCKSWQLSLNKTDIIDNFNGGARHPVRSVVGVPIKSSGLQALFVNQKSVQGDGPFFCPHCGRGVGYSFPRLKSHITVYKGKCTDLYANKKFYSCQLCSADFLDLYRVRYHNIKFGDNCREWKEAFYPETKTARYDASPFEATDSDGYDDEAASPGSHSTSSRCSRSTPEPDKCDQMAESVQDMEVATDNSTVDKQTNKFKFTLDDLITSQGKGPYFCPDCGKGMGYLRHAFKTHVGYYQGRCKSVNAGRKFYRCVHCKTDFLQLSRLRLHNTKFGNKCKTLHLSRNNESIMDNFKGEIREPLRDEDNSTDVALVIDATFYNDLKAEQGDGPYFCPLCGKGVGGSFSRLKLHINQFNGTCRKRYTGRKFYHCDVCKSDFLSVYVFNYHKKRFGNSCKNW